MIKNPVDKRIYELIIRDITTNGKNYSILTNFEISKELGISPISVRDKVIRLAKNDYLVSLVSHWDENNKFFNRKLLLGKKPA
jgi:DNA-binding GntR family transcriptional regulator